MIRNRNDLGTLARSHTRAAVALLMRVIRSREATAAARVSAANAILDRGWGKASQPSDGYDGVAEVVERIERVIVRPEHPGN